jgi:hypothetical protein
MHVSNRESIRHSIAFSDFAIFEQLKSKFQFLTCTYLVKRLRELSSTKTGSYPHEFADYLLTNIFLSEFPLEVKVN